MIQLPSRRPIFRLLLVLVALCLYTGVAASGVFIALFFDFVPIYGRCLFLVITSVCLIAVRFIYIHLKEILHT